MDAIEKAIADFVQASTSTRLQAAMRAADHGRKPRRREEDPSPTDIETMADPQSKIRTGKIVSPETPEPPSGTEAMATPPESAAAVNDPPRTDSANYIRPAFPKAPAQSQLAVSLKLKARAMRAVLLALNEGHTPWDEFSAEHVRAYEAICDQLTTCLHTKRRERVS